MEQDILTKYIDKIKHLITSEKVLPKINILTIVLIIILGLLSVQYLEIGRFIAPPFFIIVGLISLNRNKRNGWLLLTLHFFYSALIMLIDLSRVFNYGSLKLPSVLVLLLCILLIVLIHKKTFRVQYNIHSREISICIIGAVLLFILPQIFSNSRLFGFGNALYLQSFIYLLTVLFILLFLKAFPPLTTSNWNQYMEGLQYDTDTYYSKVQEILETKNVQGISYSRVQLKKRGLLSSQREYLRVQYEDIVHDISFYPFALGTYASSWSYTIITGGEAIIASIPYIGLWLHTKFYPETYYIADSRAMFQLLIHEVQLEIIDSLLVNKGLRKLTESQRQPKIKSVFDR